MPAKRPSFLKRQREQKRQARALEKREARRGRKEAKKAEDTSLEVTSPQDLAADSLNFAKNTE